MGVGGISEMSMWSLRRVAVVDRGRATLLENVGKQLGLDNWVCVFSAYGLILVMQRGAVATRCVRPRPPLRAGRKTRVNDDMTEEDWGGIKRRKSREEGEGYKIPTGRVGIKKGKVGGV